MNGIQEKMSMMSDEYLLDILHNHQNDYANEAIEIITKILNERGLSIEYIRSLKNSVNKYPEMQEPESIPVLFEMQDSMGGYQSIHNIRERKKAEKKERTARPWIRFWARLIDSILWGLTFGKLVAVVNKEFGFHLDSVLWGWPYSLVITVPWIFIESALLSLFGFTFGKWLLRVKVLNSTGDSVSFGTALKRTFLAHLFGMGLQLKFISEILNIISFFLLKKHQITKWDEIASTKVEHNTIGLKRVLIAVMVILFPLLYYMNEAYHFLF